MKKLILLLIVSGVFQVAQSRPQYAVKSGSVSCVMCHQSPAGGGSRNVYGKIYASRGLGMGKHTTTDLYGAEVRAIGAWQLEDTSKNSNGFGLMNSTVSAVVPFITNPDGTNYKAVGSYDFQGYAGATAGEIYLRYENNSATGPKPKHVIIGKFNVPFGLLTEEHRTYTKKQTKTSLNEYDFGGMLSGDLTASTHYDFSLTQGMQTGGVAPDNDITWATTLNLRQLMGPLYIGLSGIYTETSLKESPWAISGNTAINLSAFSSTLLFELMLAKNYNDSGINASGIAKFVDASLEPAYSLDIKDKQSLGIYFRYDYDVKKDLTAFYKFDGFAPDKDHLRDYFAKHTLGFRYFINSNMDIDIRHEMVDLKRAGAKASGVWASKDATLILAHAWF